MRPICRILVAVAVALAVVLAAYAPAQAAATPVVTVFTDQAATSPLMGLGVQLDPYDSFTPSPSQWSEIEQRLDFMHPGFLRVVEPASDYFGGYDPSGNPIYNWTSPHVAQLLQILTYAQSRGITVVLGDWANPLIGGDARIPAGFLSALHGTYGFTVIRYYNVINEPNNNAASCAFNCWAGIMQTISAAFTKLGLQSWLQLVGPDNENSWDDDQPAQAHDRSTGLDGDNPAGGDAWVTATLKTIPSLIGAYDSHRYATIWGVVNGVYGDQVRARREEISNLDSASKPYFGGEVGMTVRQVSPFSAERRALDARSLTLLLDPSTIPHQAGTFVDSQPHIAEFDYGVWMGDMMVQALESGLSGASAWDLDDAMHVGGQYGSQNLKQWGFWNTLGGQYGYPASDLNTRPWYYAWSVVSRAFPAGSQVLNLPGTGISGVRVVAARIPVSGGYHLSFAVVNDSAGAQSVTLRLPAVTSPATLARYDYFNGDAPVDANGFATPATTVQVNPATGLSVALPSQGLVVLTSLGVGAPFAFDQGTRTIVDPLRDWRHTYAHTKGLKFDHNSPAQFNYASSRLEAYGKKAQFLAYHAGQMASFELKAYYAKSLSLTAFGSEDGNSWWPISLASANPAPAVGGLRFLADLFPANPLPAGTNRLKLDLGRGTELAQVGIAASRSGPACLGPGSPSTSSSLAGAPLGASTHTMLALLGAPTASRRSVWNYCVMSGTGGVTVVFSRFRVELVASTAGAYALDGIVPGNTVARLQKRLGRVGLKPIGHQLLAGPNGAVFAIASGRVTAVTVATSTLSANPRALLHAIRTAGLG